MDKKRIVSLEELQAEVEKPVVVRIAIRSVEYEVEVRRLRPSEEAVLQLILMEARPPQKVTPNERGEPKMEFDLADLEYEKKSVEKQREARALAIWWCCPLFRGSKDAPELKAEATAGDRQKVVEYVQSKLTGRALEHLYAAARGDVDGLREGDSIEERVGFI